MFNNFREWLSNVIEKIKGFLWIKAKKIVEESANNIFDNLNAPAPIEQAPSAPDMTQATPQEAPQAAQQATPVAHEASSHERKDIPTMPEWGDAHMAA